jgi:hypothetical protein
MNEIFLDLKELYWAHRDIARLAMGGAAIVLTQMVLVLYALRRLRELSHMRERMSRLADGLALLTDTTEAGLSALAKEIRLSKKSVAPVRTPTRAAVAKRVAAAPRKHDRPVAIADREALSESEVRLHLALKEAEAASRVRPNLAS